MTYLSPYISRGVISTRSIFHHIKQRHLPWPSIEKYVQELAWRDYWQQVWLAKGDELFQDIKHPQMRVRSFEMPSAIVNACTGIKVIDDAISELYETGYMHNHMRMYIASICCNIAQCHWLTPAKWLYAHLLDADLASNHLSWQWVAGSFSSKKYFANQENINKYTATQQRDTFLDVNYETLTTMSVPDVLKATEAFTSETNLPECKPLVLSREHKVLVYNLYNLDPNWHMDKVVDRVLLLEPSKFKKYPVSQKVLEFALELSSNIDGIKVFTGEITDLIAMVGAENVVFKEHPLNTNYMGHQQQRDWLTNTKGYYSSFFKFWKLSVPHLKA